MAYCGERCISTTEGSAKIAVTLKCRSWGCADCAPRRQRQLVAQAIAGHPTRLLTLTSRRTEGTTAERAAKALVLAWRLIRRRIHSQHADKRVEFLAIFERTQLGWPHLHILMRGPYLDQRWLSAQMQELTDSPIVDIRRVKSKRGAAHYVAKYTAKGPGQFGTLKRYWRSKAYEVVPYIKKKSAHLWDIQTMSLHKWAQAFVEFGWTVTFIEADKAKAQPP